MCIRDRRLVYLNPACVDAVKQYLAARAKLEILKDKQALFVSRRTGRRLSPRRVEQIVSHQLKCAGLDGYGSVSYTHLDVYKRQTCIRMTTRTTGSNSSIYQMP